MPVSERKARYESLHQAMMAAAQRAVRFLPTKFGKVAAVLDASYSMSGSSEKKRRPLGVALAASYLLRAACKSYRPFWTHPLSRKRELLIQARGQTPLGEWLLNALATRFSGDYFRWF